MKLHNKKTGEVVEADYISVARSGFGLADKDGNIIAKDIHALPLCYSSVRELTSEFEDYTPAEPLIKDEKIRKAVRAWAEADDLDNFRVQNQHFNECKIIGYTAGINKASFIGFQTTIAHADNNKLYDIAELCGEGEE